MRSVKECGVVGNGKADDHIALQQAIDREEELFFPSGKYIVSDTIRVPSNRKLVFEKGAVLQLKAKTARKRGDFLLTNRDVENGNKNIIIMGATFDGNNGHSKHKRPKNIFQKDGYSGILINFCNVKNLVLSNITLQNPVSYYTRFCMIDGFSIEDIILKSKKISLNQDGIHFAGKVKNGTVKNVRVDSYGQTNDDLLAINADDYLGRIEEFDTVCGEIENILFENIYAESCHDAVRLISFRSSIRNLTFRNLNVGFRRYAIDCNAARGCRAELFKEKDEPNGVGDVKDVTFIDCTFWMTREYPLFWKGSLGILPHPYILWGSNADGIKMENCRFIEPPPLKKYVLKYSIKTAKNGFPAFEIKNVKNEVIISDGKTYKIEKKEDKVIIPDFTDLTINSTK